MAANAPLKLPTDDFKIAAYTQDRFVAIYGGITGASERYKEAVATVAKKKRKLIDGALHGGNELATSDDHPTYLSLFKEKWAERAAPGSLEAWDSHVAYLAHLYTLARQIEGENKSDSLETKPDNLETRRPDLADLLIDDVAVNKEVSTLELVNEILSKSIDKQNSINLDQKLSTTRYPFSLPFHLPLNQITLGLRAAKTSLGTVIRQTSQQSSGFIGEGIGGESARAALRAYVELSLEQQKILTDKINNKGKYSHSKAEEAYLQLNYGSLFNNEEGKFQTPHCRNLWVKLDTFCQMTGLQCGEMDQLLARGVYAATCSPKIVNPSSQQPITVSQENKFEAPEYGAIYLRQDENITAFTVSEDRMIGTPAVFARLNRLIRLQRWLTLPYDQLDWLVAALARASNNKNQVEEFNDGMLRGLGLFRHLQREYRLEADEFAALIYKISPYACDNATSLLDRLFYATGSGTSIRIDDQPFNINDSETVQHLCTGLGVSEAIFAQLAALVESACGELKRSLSIISALYRLVKIPRLLGLSVEEGLMLLRLIGDKQNDKDVYIKILLSPSITEASEGHVDILDVILALESAVHWLKAHKLSVAQVVAWCTSSNLPHVDKGALLKRLHPLKQAIQPFVLSEASFACIELPLPPNGSKESIKWLASLKNFVNEKGIVIAPKAFEHLTEWEKTEKIIEVKKEEIKEINKKFEELKKEKIKTLHEEILMQKKQIRLNNEEVGQYLPETLTIYKKGSNGDNYQLEEYFSKINEAQSEIFNIYCGQYADDWEKKILLEQEKLMAAINKICSINLTGKSSELIHFNALLGRFINFQKDFYLKIKNPTLFVSLLEKYDALDKIYKNPLFCEYPEFNSFIEKISPLKNEVDDLSKIQEKLSEKLTQEDIDPKTTFFKEIFPSEETSLSEEAFLSVSTQLLQIISRAHAAQLNATASTLSQLYNLPLEVLRAVLQWPHFDWHALVSKTLDLTEDAPNKISDEYLQTVCALDCHVGVVKKLKLSAMALETLLTRPEWTKHVDLTLQDIYRLSRYADFLSPNAKDEAQAIDYLQHFNANGQIHTDSTYTLLAGLLSWEKSEVKTAMEKAGKQGDNPLDHLDWLMRLHTLSRQTRLSVASLLEAAKLYEMEGFSEWQAVGQAVISAAARAASTQAA